MRGRHGGELVPSSVLPSRDPRAAHREALQDRPGSVDLDELVRRGLLVGFQAPTPRIEASSDVARAAAGGKLSLARGAVHAGREALSALPGIGPWTLEYIALRGLGDPDAFPIGDAGLRAAFTGDLAKISETWRPWRGYAAAMIWARTPVETREAA